MADDKASIALDGLTALQVAELRQALTKAGADSDQILNVAPKRGGASETRQGEPVTMVVVLAVSQVVLWGVACYLAKGRSGKEIDEEFRYRSPSGEELTYRVRSKATTEEALSADVLEQLKGFTIPRPSGGTPPP